jgi:hypothetical protein
MANEDKIKYEKKQEDLEQLKSLEDGIITFIQHTDQIDCKNVFLSMLINYVMCYSDYTPSITAIESNKGIAFENYIKNYLLKLLKYYETQTTLNNDKVSFSQIKIMLLSFFHKKISVIIPVVNEIHNIKTGKKRAITISQINAEEKVLQIEKRAVEQIAEKKIANAAKAEKQLAKEIQDEKQKSKDAEIQLKQTPEVDSATKAADSATKPTESATKVVTATKAADSAFKLIEASTKATTKTDAVKAAESATVAAKEATEAAAAATIAAETLSLGQDAAKKAAKKATDAAKKATDAAKKATDAAEKKSLTPAEKKIEDESKRLKDQAKQLEKDTIRLEEESKKELEEQKLNNFEDLSEITKELEALLNMFSTIF